jgi:hypothetical protein
MLLLASLGYAGANLHGGDGRMVAIGLGGTLPGDALVHDEPASHPHPYYTPIAHIGSRYVAEPVSYGMRFAQRFAGAQIIPVDFDPGPVNATAYAASLPGRESDPSSGLVAIINKDATRSLQVSLPFRPSAVEIVSAESLTATEVHTRKGAGGEVPPHSMAVFTLSLTS